MTGSGEPVRVLHVAEAFGGGLLEMVRLVAEGGARAGMPQAIAYGERPETPEDVRAAVAEPVELLPVGWRSRSAPAQLRAARALQRAVDAWRPDVVHLHSSFAGVVGVAVRTDAPVIFTPHAFASALPSRSAPARWAYRRLEHVVCRRADLVGAVSRSEAQLARELGARDVRVVLNGIPELDAPAAAEARPARPQVVALGRLIAQRRPDACARILARLADVADVAWIGGGGSQGAYGRRARAALDAAGVEVTGWLPRHDAIARLRAASAYLHWTAWDGQPLSVLEAMAGDTPVVASDIAPNREILGPEQVCASEDEAVALLRRIVGDEAFADRLRAAQAEVRGAYGAGRMVAEWLALYRELAGLS